MGANSLQAAAPRRRSFNLSGFRCTSSASEGQEVLKNADERTRNTVMEEAARLQKAAAWQWYTRGVGEAALLTPTRPPVWNLQPRASNDKSCIRASEPRSKEGQANICNSTMPQKKIVEPPPAVSPKTASHFKAEAGLSFTRPAASAGGPPTVPAPSAPSGGPSTSLYDEAELSRLRSHMAHLVQRLEHQHTSDNKQPSSAVGDHKRSRPLPPPVSTNHHQTKDPPAVAVASSGDDQLTTLPSPAPVASTIPFHKRPLSALQKLFRKVLSGSVPKCTRNPSQIIDSAPAVYEPPEGLHNDIYSTSQRHHHHYIHHYHHHYHHTESPEDQTSIILSRRRHSESASSRPCTPSIVEAYSDEEEEEDEDEAEESRIAAYLARRRRRHSGSFYRSQLRREDAGCDKDERMKEESAKVEWPQQISRRYNSERFLPSRLPTMVGQDQCAHPVEDEFDEDTFAGIRGRRRHSAELRRGNPSLERRGGRSEGGAYRLGRGGAGGGTPASMPMTKRRYSESLKVRPETDALPTPSPGTPYRISPSARYYIDVQERYVGVPIPANAAT